MSTKLTPAQHAVLAYAVNHTEGKITWFPENIKGGVRKKVLDGLFNRELIAPDGTDWFVAADGYDALGFVRPEPTAAAETGADPSAADPDLDSAVASLEGQWAKEPATPVPAIKTRSGTKQATVVEMLTRPEGATIAQIREATGWQAHTVRGTFAGTFKRKGLSITSDKAQDGERIYRIV